MNIFKVLSSNDGSINEPNVSSFLSYLLDPNENHGLSSKFLEYFISSIVLENKDMFKDLIYEGRIRDLSRNSPYDIRIEPEYSVICPDDNSGRRRDIDILVEIHKSEKDNLKPDYIFCIENKISDGSINTGKDQLFEELTWVYNEYNDNDNKAPFISLIFISPGKSRRALSEYNNFLKKMKEATNISFSSCHYLWNSTENKKYSIIHMLESILSDESMGRIEPIYEYTKHTIKSFISFIRSDFSSYKEEKIQNYQRKDYGKPVIEYINDVHSQYPYDQKIMLSDLRERVRQEIKNKSGKEIHNTTLSIQTRIVVVNEKNRRHHFSNPRQDKRNLFYYPDENNRKIIKKLDLNNPPAGIKIYWRDEENEDNLGQCLITDLYPSE